MMEHKPPRQIANETLRELEIRHDLLKYRIGEWCIWPFLRFPVFIALAGLNKESRDPNAYLSHAAQFRYLLRDALAFLRLSHHRIAVLVDCLSLVERNNSQYKDMYFDDLLENIDSFVKIEHNFNKSFFNRNKQALFPPNITILPILWGSQLLHRIPTNTKYRNVAKDISNHLAELPQPHHFDQRWIQNQIGIFYWRKVIYKFLLLKIDNEMLFLKTAYTNYPLVAAARELGIEVVEFQHGIIDHHHAGYSWPSYAIPYKFQIPLPHRVFLYGHFWEQALREDGFWNEELKVVGSLRMDRYRGKHTVRSENKISLLFTTQNMDADAISRFLSEFVQLASNELDIHLIVKLHPAETTKRAYETNLNQFQQVEIFFHNEGVSTFELLKKSHYHLSVYSTVHFEAIGLGVPSIVIPLTNYQTVKGLYEPGYVLLAQSPQHLVEIIKNKAINFDNRNLSDFFFEPNALNNMLHELADRKDVYSQTT